MLMDDPQVLMAHAVNALKQGNRQQARELLLKVLEHNEHNEEAWLWLAGAIDDPYEQRIALENVLFINPDNARAKQGLDWMRKQNPQAFVDDTPPLSAPPATGPTVALEPPPPATGPTVALEPPAASLADLAAIPPGAPIPAYSVPDASGAALGSAAPSDQAPPCPRCGTAVPLQQTRCAKCKLLQIEKIPNPNARVGMLKMSGIMGIIFSTIIYVLPAILLMILLASTVNSLKRVALQNIETGTDSYETQAAQFDEFIGPIVEPAYTRLLMIALIGIIGIVCAVWAMKRSLAAYIVAWLFYGVHALVAVWITISFSILRDKIAAIIISASSDLGPAAVSKADIDKALGIMTAILLLGAVFLLLIMLGLILSLNVFRKKTLRMALKVSPSGDADEHFNLGLRYQRRGLWYQAAAEWEVATQINPADATYHHALGLAYARLNRPDMGLRSLVTALQLNPGDPGIQEDHQKLTAALTKGSPV